MYYMGQAVLIIARKMLQSPTTVGKPLRGIIGNVIVHRGIILSTLQLLIDRSIKLEMMFTEYV